jgi:hypothetical protein
MGRHGKARPIGTLIVLVLLALAPPVRAQGVEIGLLGGYRFGGDLFEIAAAHQLDNDGAPALGVVVDVPLGDGLHLEGSFSHQQLDVLGPIPPFGPPAIWRITVDQWQGGGLQEFRGGRIRPFATGLLGLTRYAAEADSELRFMVGAGGGVKLLPTSHVGIRLDGRLFATFVDAAASTIACGRAGCLVALHVNIAWQAELTAGIVVRIH